MPFVTKVPVVGQTQGAASIDTSNPLASRLAVAFSGTAGGSGFRLESVGSLGPLPSPGGVMLGGFDGSSYAVLAGSRRITPGAWTCVFQVLYTGESTNNITWVSQGGAGSGGRGWAINSGGASGKRIRLVYGGVAVYSDSVAEIPVGRLSTIAVSVSGSGGVARYFIDGVLDSSRTVGTLSMTASRDTTIGANHSGSAFAQFLPTGCAVGAVLIWDRELSTEEVASVSRNPWQLFAPPSRIIPVTRPVPPLRPFEAVLGPTSVKRLRVRWTGTGSNYFVTDSIYVPEGTDVLLLRIASSNGTVLFDFDGVEQTAPFVDAFDGNSNRLRFFEFLNPTPGLHQIAFRTTNTNDVGVVSNALSGLDMTAHRGIPVSTSGYSQFTNLTSTDVAVGDLVVHGTLSSHEATPTAGQDVEFNGALRGWLSAASKTGDGNPVTFSWTHAAAFWRVAVQVTYKIKPGFTLVPRVDGTADGVTPESGFAAALSSSDSVAVSLNESGASLRVRLGE